jgi:hypothetical protein
VLAGPFQFYACELPDKGIERGHSVYLAAIGDATVPRSEERADRTLFPAWWTFERTANTGRKGKARVLAREQMAKLQAKWKIENGGRPPLSDAGRERISQAQKRRRALRARATWAGVLCGRSAAARVVTAGT